MLLRTPVGIVVESIMAAESAAAPNLIDAEVFHRLITFGKQSVLAPHEVKSGIADLRDAPMDRVDHRLLMTRATEFSAALSGYDALYAALAAELDATLVTGDDKFARTARSQLALRVADLSP